MVYRGRVAIISYDPEEPHGLALAQEEARDVLGVREGEVLRVQNSGEGQLTVMALSRS